MMRNKYSVIIMMIALFGGKTALAQEKKPRGKNSRKLSGHRSVS